MDLLGARTEVRERLQEQVEDFWSDAEIDRALNEGLRRFSTAEKWSWLYTSDTSQSLAAGAATLALETAVAFPRHFNIMLTPTGSTQPYLPKRVDPVTGFKLRVMYPTQQSYPQWYYIASVAEDAAGEPDRLSEFIYTVRFVPTPSQAFGVEYQYLRLPTALTADATELDVPDEFATAVVAYATFLCWKKELTWEHKAQEALIEYHSILGEARKEQRRQAIDEELAWGKEEPELYTSSTEAEYALLRIPPTLG